MDIIHIETCKNYDNKECDLGRSHKKQIATVIAVLKRLKLVIILFRKTNYTSNKECDLGRSHKKKDFTAGDYFQIRLRPWSHF